MGGNPDTWVTPDSDSSCSESAADAPAGGKASPPPHATSLTGGVIGGSRFSARTLVVQSSPHLPYIFLGLCHYMQLTRAIDIINNSTGVRGVFAANATRTGGSTEIVFLIERVGVRPANGSSIPLHPSTLIDEHSIGVSTISDQNSLEGTGNVLWVYVLCGVM